MHTRYFKLCTCHSNYCRSNKRKYHETFTSLRFQAKLKALQRSKSEDGNGSWELHIIFHSTFANNGINSTLYSKISNGLCSSSKKIINIIIDCRAEACEGEFVVIRKIRLFPFNVGRLKVRAITHWTISGSNFGRSAITPKTHFIEGKFQKQGFIYELGNNFKTSWKIVSFYLTPIRLHHCGGIKKRQCNLAGMPANSNK